MITFTFLYRICQRFHFNYSSFQCAAIGCQTIVWARPPPLGSIISILTSTWANICLTFLKLLHSWPASFITLFHGHPFKFDCCFRSLLLLLLLLCPSLTMSFTKRTGPLRPSSSDSSLESSGSCSSSFSSGNLCSKFATHNGLVKCVCLGQTTGEVFASVSNDEQIKLWSIASSQCLMVSLKSVWWLWNPFGWLVLISYAFLSKICQIMTLPFLFSV